MGLCA
jgi:ATP-binding cassette subfamily A (ABC1) protein 3